MSKELEALRKINKHCIHYYGVRISEMKGYLLIEQALNELEDAKHNYKAVKEMYDNATAYGAKIQKELNELKKRNEPMKPKHEEDGTRSCPRCHANWLTPNFKYCSDCGQALDWSDEK